MKLSRKWLLIILSVLVIFNVSIILINKNVNSNITIAYVYTSENDKTTEAYMDMVKKDDNANKVHFALISPQSDKYQDIMKKYDIKGTSALLILGPTNKLIDKISGPDEETLVKEINKYLK